MKPAIGVVADFQAGAKHAVHSVQQKYLDAVAGGSRALAFILPARIDAAGSAWADASDLDAALDRLDGIFLSGAVSNIAPAHYGEVLADPRSPADPARDAVTLPLVTRALARGMPVLGVCRGFQEINVALGGTLHQAVQAVPGFDDHRENSALELDAQYGPAHDVRFVPGGVLALLTGLEGAAVNSLHGQGVDRLAPGLVAEAYAPDGLVEAFRPAHGDHFLLGLQWHPEWHFRDDPVSIAIFRAFGEAARAYSAARQG
jgi:putative glutamine amidotransferase